MAIVTIGERFTYHNDVVEWVADEFGFSRIEAKELADQFIQVLLQTGGLTIAAPDAADLAAIRCDLDEVNYRLVAEEDVSPPRR